MTQERRATTRFDIHELIFVSSDAETRAGLLMNISPQGAQVEFSEPLARNHHHFTVGDPVDLQIEELGELSAQVNRTWEKGVAVEFRIDGQEQEMLLAEIQEAFAAA